MTQDKGKLVHSHPANELTEKLFGIESVVIKTKNDDADATDFLLVSDAVPSGKIWNITYIAARNNGGITANWTAFSVNHDNTHVEFYSKVGSVAQYTWFHIPVNLYLDVGDYMVAGFGGVTIGDTCYLNIFGYEMNAP